MHVSNQQFGDGFLLVMVLQFYGIIILDCAQQKGRILSRLGRTAGFSSIWPGKDGRSSTSILCSVWITADLFRHIVFHHDAHSNPPLSLSEKVAIAALCTVMFIFLVFAIRFQLSLRGLNDFRVSRGRLYNAISKLAKRSGFFRLEEAPLYVIPVTEYSKICVRVRNGVALPRQFLDYLTREEINALAARQLCLESLRPYFRSFWILLGCNVVVVSIGQWLQLTPLLAFLIYLTLLAGEMVAFIRYSPAILLQADLSAIKLTGNA
ncbi:MAG: hypothetical protein WAN35_18375, partial [Terracidiphilus sp.]